MHNCRDQLTGKLVIVTPIIRLVRFFVIGKVHLLIPIYHKLTKLSRMAFSAILPSAKIACFDCNPKRKRGNGLRSSLTLRVTISLPANGLSHRVFGGVSSLAKGAGAAHALFHDLESGHRCTANIKLKQVTTLQEANHARSH